MSGPSANWPVPGPTGRVVIENANWYYLCSRASQWVSAARGEAVTCSVNLTRYHFGTRSVHFELSFSDGSFGVVKVRPESSPSTRAEMLSTIATLKVLAENTSIPVPRVYGYEIDDDNLFSYPFIVMSALAGKKTDYAFAWSIPEEHRKKFAGELARVVFDLSRLIFNSIGRIQINNFNKGYDITSFPFRWETELQMIGPFHSSTNYVRGFLRVIEDELANDPECGLTVQEYSRFLQVLEDCSPILLSHGLLQGPFPLAHPNLTQRHILFDENYNITGILGWTGAHTVPVEKFCAMYQLMPGIGSSRADNAPMVNFRIEFTKAIQKLEREARDTTGLPVGTLFATTIPDKVYWCFAHPKPFDVENADETSLLIMRLVHGRDISLDYVGSPLLDNSSLCDHVLDVAKDMSDEELAAVYKPGFERMLLIWREVTRAYFEEEGSDYDD